MKNNSCIMVCVTPQSSCRRLIETGAAKAKENNTELIVISVLNTFSNNMNALTELYDCVERNGADMNLYFNSEPVLTAAVAAKKFGAKELITGFPGENSSAFIAQLHELLPEIPVCMVDGDGMQYRIIRSTPEEILLAKQNALID